MEQDSEPEAIEIKRHPKSTMANKLRLRTKGLTIEFIEPRMIETDSIAQKSVMSEAKRYGSIPCSEMQISTAKAS